MNKIFLIGYLGKTPELQTTANGKSLCKFSIATNRYTKKNGERVKFTEWHSIIAWDKTAELASQYLRKGSQVLIEGRIKTSHYETKDGEKRSRTEIVVERIEFLGAKSAA